MVEMMLFVATALTCAVVLLSYEKSWEAILEGLAYPIIMFVGLIFIVGYIVSTREKTTHVPWQYTFVFSMGWITTLIIAIFGAH